MSEKKKQPIEVAFFMDKEKGNTIFQYYYEISNGYENSIDHDKIIYSQTNISFATSLSSATCVESILTTSVG